MSVILLAVLLSSAPAQTAVVQWTGERLTVRSVNAPLRALMDDVAQRTGIIVSGADRLVGNTPVDIRDAYLTDALQILLANVNFIITRQDGLLHLRIHSMTGNAPPASGPISIPGLTDQLVNRSDRVPGSPAADADDDEKREELAALERAAESLDADSTLEISSALQSDYSDVRIRALHLLGARSEDPDAIAEILSAFSDEDENVVLTASDLLASIPGLAVLDALENQLTPDTSEELQFAALRSLALRGDISSIDAVRRTARQGPVAVRAFAEQLLKALEERAKESAAPKPPG